MVTKTALFMGVDNCKPLKKASILITIPNTAQMAMRPQSLRSIFCFGANGAIHQNKSAAPLTLKNINPKGCT